MRLEGGGYLHLLAIISCLKDIGYEYVPWVGMCRISPHMGCFCVKIYQELKYVKYEYHVKHVIPGLVR